MTEGGELANHLLVIVTTVVDDTGNGYVPGRPASDFWKRSPGTWRTQAGRYRWSADLSSGSAYLDCKRRGKVRTHQTGDLWCSHPTIEVYMRHLRHLATSQYVAKDKSPVEVLRSYLPGKATSNQTSSNMRQIISAVRLGQELELLHTVVPKNIWRMVRSKDRLAGKGPSQGWGSLKVLEVMARRAHRYEDKVVVSLAILSIVFCLRISEATSIRGIDLDQSSAFVRLYDFKTKDKWIKRPAGTYVCRIVGFLRLQMELPVFKGGSQKLGEAMARLVRETDYRDLRWHCCRRARATMFARAGASMSHLMAWGRWRSLRVARKYVAWTGGLVPWPRVIPGTPTKWRFDFEPFRAREFSPAQQFVRDQDEGWEVEGSDAKGVGESLAAIQKGPEARDVVQGAKRVLDMDGSAVRTEGSTGQSGKVVKDTPAQRKRKLKIDQVKEVTAHGRRHRSVEPSERTESWTSSGKPRGGVLPKAKSRGLSGRIKSLAEKARTAARAGAGIQ